MYTLFFYDPSLFGFVTTLSFVFSVDVFLRWKISVSLKNIWKPSFSIVYGMELYIAVISILFSFLVGFLGRRTRSVVGACWKRFWERKKKGGF